MVTAAILRLAVLCAFQHLHKNNVILSVMQKYLDTGFTQNNMLTLFFRGMLAHI